jgi:Squalene-hopene cyclase C-terminal domain
MKLITTGLTIAATLGLLSQAPAQLTHGPDPTSAAADRGAQWLASVQGPDGGWGQDGGQMAFVRSQEHLESTGNDVANTSVAALALLRAGPQYRNNIERAVVFVLERVEASPTVGLAVTDLQGTQIQRKLGPYIDTFLSSMLLAEVDGRMSTGQLNSRVRDALQKVVWKIEQNQRDDGSWNIDGGWAPVLGTSMASRSLFAARARGLDVDETVLNRADDYTRDALGPVTRAGVVVGAASPEAAGVPLYQSAQALEQLSRTEADRERNATEIAAIRGQLADAQFVEGFGSVGGEEFFSYLNVSEGLRRTGGDAWESWHSDITRRILIQQNADGSWAGHHCITGRVAVTAGAILNLTVDTHAG